MIVPSKPKDETLANVWMPQNEGVCDDVMTDLMRICDKYESGR